MGMRAVGPVAGVLGGLCWALRWVSDATGVATDWGDSVRWLGLVLLGTALVAVGAGVVSRSALWLRVIVGVALPALVWSLYWAVRGDGDAVALDGVVGLLAALLSAVCLVVVRRGVAPAAPRSGSHAAR